MNAVGPDLASSTIVIAVLAATCVLLVAVFAWLIIVAGRRKTALLPSVDLRIDVARLASDGPPTEGPTLEFYGMPVRLVALVLAPAGRHAELPSQQELVAALDDLVPGLAAVVSSHRPMLRQWPTQLSTQGFTHAFFNNVQLPGDRGKGTRWCSVAGRFEARDQQLMAGMLCAAEKPNSMSQVAIAHIGQWLDVVRVKT
jgi:hypothetical protein